MAHVGIQLRRVLGRRLGAARAVYCGRGSSGRGRRRLEPQPLTVCFDKREHVGSGDRAVDAEALGDSEKVGARGRLM